MVAVPLRAGPLLAWMSSCTVPFPDRLPPAAMPIHGALLDASHVQSGDVVTLTTCGPPAAGAAIVSGATVGLQPPSCVTVNVWPETVMPPLRGPPVFAATVNCRSPAPAPLGAD